MPKLYRLVRQLKGSLPSTSEEAALLLLARARGGCNAALEAVLLHYYPLIAACCRRYHVRGLERDDLLQEGMIAALEAVRNYREGGGLPFKKFLALCIDRQMCSLLVYAHRKKRWSPDHAGPLSLDALAARPGARLPALPGPDEACLQPEGDFVEQVLEEFLSPYHLSQLELAVARAWLGGSDWGTVCYASVAAEVGCSRKQVDNALQRFKKKLRKYIAGRLGLPGEPAKQKNRRDIA